MKIEIHSLYNENINPSIVEYHKKVFSYFGHTPKYSNMQIYPGKWYDYIMNNSNADIIIFSDIDAVPINNLFYDEMIEYCKNDYLIGVTQVTPNCNSVYNFYCASGFMAITKKYYNEIGRPSFMDDCSIGCDVSQQITNNAMKYKKRIRLWFPESFQGIPKGGLWRYGSYGYNGIGCIYDNKIYHLFESRFEKNTNLFIDTCNQILKNKPENIERPYSCKSEYLNKFPINMNY